MLPQYYVLGKKLLAAAQALAACVGDERFQALGQHVKKEARDLYLSYLSAWRREVYDDYRCEKYDAERVSGPANFDSERAQAVVIEQELGSLDVTLTHPIIPPV